LASLAIWIIGRDRALALSPAFGKLGEGGGAQLGLEGLEGFFLVGQAPIAFTDVSEAKGRGRHGTGGAILVLSPFRGEGGQLVAGNLTLEPMEGLFLVDESFVAFADVIEA
jgi:hypothetical protein